MRTSPAECLKCKGQVGKRIEEEEFKRREDMSSNNGGMVERGGEREWRENSGLEN